jgi:hypothetical protein
MGKKILFISLSLLLFCHSYGQAGKEYVDWIRKAKVFYDAKQYDLSAGAFTSAFASNGGKEMAYDRYNAACSWALAGNHDSAFFMLMRIATQANYTAITQLTGDNDLLSLHSDKRWNTLCAIVKQNKEKSEANLDKALVASLDTILNDDQDSRMKFGEIQKKYGFDSKKVTELSKIIEKNDSVNVIKVTKILDKYGWVGPDVAGREGSMAIFLVIQHADIKTQEKYLPMMREAVMNKKAAAASFAMLEDRVALREGRKQIYGSQVKADKNGIYHVSSLENPDNVDKRRAEVGLGPLAEYVAYWKIKWDAEQYKKELPAIEQQEKNNQ